MTPTRECTTHIATLAAGLDSKLNELAALLPRSAHDAIDNAQDALTRVLAETKKAVEGLTS